MRGRCPVCSSHVLAATLLASIAAQHLKSEVKFLSDALSLRVRRRPQLQILDPVVGADPVSMVHDFIGQQRAPQVLSHDEPMLTDGRLSIRQVTQLRRHRDLPVPVAQRSLAGDDSDRLVSADVAVLERPLVVSAAQPVRLGATVAAFHGADVGLPLSRERRVGLDVPGAVPPQIVAMAPTACDRDPLVAIDGAGPVARLRSERHAAVAEHPLVVAAAEPSGIACAVAVVNAAHVRLLVPADRHIRPNVARRAPAQVVRVAPAAGDGGAATTADRARRPLTRLRLKLSLARLPPVVGLTEPAGIPLLRAAVGAALLGPVIGIARFRGHATTRWPPRIGRPRNGGTVRVGHAAGHHEQPPLSI